MLVIPVEPEGINHVGCLVKLTGCRSLGNYSSRVKELNVSRCHA